MTIKAQIIADSISPVGKRLTCFLVTFPKFIAPELLRHRSMSFCSESSRARPIQKMIRAVWDDQASPIEWGANQPGMVAGGPIPIHKQKIAQWVWRLSGWMSLLSCWLLARLGVHKQVSNRILDPYAHVTLIVQATEWGNFFNLRCHPGAQPEMKRLALLMASEYARSVPKKLNPGENHLPFADRFAEGLTEEEKIKVSVARCARVSYLNHDQNVNHKKDFELYQRLLDSKHMSPFEFQATCLSTEERSGNLIGWRQHRKMLPGENQEKFNIEDLLNRVV